MIFSYLVLLLVQNVSLKVVLCFFFFFFDPELRAAN